MPYGGGTPLSSSSNSDGSINIIRGRFDCQPSHPPGWYVHIRKEGLVCLGRHLLLGVICCSPCPSFLCRVSGVRTTAHDCGRKKSADDCGGGMRRARSVSRSVYPTYRRPRGVYHRCLTLERSARKKVVDMCLLFAHCIRCHQRRYECSPPRVSFLYREGALLHIHPDKQGVIAGCFFNCS